MVQRLTPENYFEKPKLQPEIKKYMIPHQNIYQIEPIGEDKTLLYLGLIFFSIITVVAVASIAIVYSKKR
jgi:hypothetical protein